MAKNLASVGGYGHMQLCRVGLFFWIAKPKDFISLAHIPCVENKRQKGKKQMYLLSMDLQKSCKDSRPPRFLFFLLFPILKCRIFIWAKGVCWFMIAEKGWWMRDEDWVNIIEKKV